MHTFMLKGLAAGLCVCICRGLTTPWLLMPSIPSCVPQRSSTETCADIMDSEHFVLIQVEDGQIQRMEVMHNKGAGPRALYEALGGKMPVSV